MIGTAQHKQHAEAVAEIFAFMARCGLDLDDLITVAGGDLSSTNPRRVEKARRVEKCWSLMARLSVKYSDLESAPPPTPDKQVRRRTDEGHFSQVIEIASVSDTLAVSPKSNEINGLAKFRPVGDPDRNPIPTFLKRASK